MCELVGLFVGVIARMPVGNDLGAVQVLLGRLRLINGLLGDEAYDTNSSSLRSIQTDDERLW